MKIALPGIDYTNYLAPWIGHTRKLVEAYFSLVLEQKGLNISQRQWLLLSYLKATGGVSQNELAACLSRDKTSITRMLSAMERKNMVARISNPQDKRSNIIKLTKNGEKILEKALPVIKEIIESIQSDISIDEIHRTIETLKKMQAKVNELQLVALETK